MNPNPFASSLTASRDATGHQTYPAGALYIAATPIGNLGDITLRALNLFQIADVIACEDTRHTHHLLHAYGLHLDAAKFVAVHQHNEAEASVKIVSMLQAGLRVVYVSDAGTPGVSDPGARLVNAAHTSGYRVIPIPGVSSITALLSVAGIADHTGFLFAGFLPPKAAERDRVLEMLQARNENIILLESPHRIGPLFSKLSELLGDREVTVGRELTKRYEEVVKLRASELPHWLRGHAGNLGGTPGDHEGTEPEQELSAEAHAPIVQTTKHTEPERRLGSSFVSTLPAQQAVQIDAVALASPVAIVAPKSSTSRSRGEFALLLHALRAVPVAAVSGSVPADPQTDRLLRALMRELPLKTAVSIALEAEGGGASRKELYRRALELQRVNEGDQADRSE